MNSDAPLATDFGYSSQGDPEDNSDTILPSDREFTSSIDLLPPPGLPSVREATSTAQVWPHGVDHHGTNSPPPLTILRDVTIARRYPLAHGIAIEERKECTVQVST